MRHLTSLVAVSFVVVATAGAAFAGDVDVIVGFKSSADASVVTRRGGRATDMGLGKALAARVPASAVSALRADPAVAYVEEDGVVTLLGRVDSTARPGGGGGGGGGTTPPQTTPWGVTRVGGGSGGSGVTVAVIDTGADLKHADLAANLVRGKTFVNGTKNENDDNGHGSHVSGTIAAVNNTQGVVGVAPSAKVMPIKVLDRNGSGSWSAVAAGIRYAADQGAAIASMSLGGGASTTVADAVDYAYTNGTMLVAAAGNSGDGSTTTTETSYPAAYAHVVAVGATDVNDNLANFSSTGSFVDVSGPGVGVYSTYKSGGYATLNGTSMATPHASGVAALIWAATTNPTPDAVESALLGAVDASHLPTTDPYGWGYGAGIVHTAQ